MRRTKRIADKYDNLIALYGMLFEHRNELAIQELNRMCSRMQCRMI